MAIGIGNYTNIDTSDPTNYPDGQIKDDALGINGTPVSKQTYGDIQQFFYKILDAAGVTPNNLYDNVTNDYQYYKAMNKFINSYVKVIVEYLIGNAYDPAVCYVFSGLTTETADGYIFFDGELMFCSGRAGAACGGGLVPILGRTTDVIDMLTTAAVVCGTAGTSDICDYADLYFLGSLEEFGAYQRSTFNGDTIPLTRNRFSKYINPVSGATNILTIDTTDCTPGVEVDLLFASLGGEVISFTGGTPYILTGTASPTITLAGNNIVRIKCLSTAGRYSVQVFQNIA